MSWFYSEKVKPAKPPQDDNISLERGLILGGFGSLAIQNVFFQIQNYIRIFIRETMNNLYPNNGNYSIVKMNKDEGKKGSIILCGYENEHLVWNHTNLYYFHPLTAKVYTCKKFTKASDPDSSNFCYKLNPYILSLFKQMKIRETFVQDNPEEMLSAILLHMIINDFYFLFHNCENNSKYKENINYLIEAMLYRHKPLPSKTNQSFVGLFFWSKNKAENTEIVHETCSKILSNFVGKFVFSEEIEKDMVSLSNSLFFTNSDQESDVSWLGPPSLLNMHRGQHSSFQMIFVDEDKSLNVSNFWTCIGKWKYKIVSS
jgi:hypothetical protein